VPDNDCDVVVVGASAGGVEALTRMVRALPADFAAPVLVVLHVSPSGPSVLHEILDRAGPLHAVRAEDGAKLEHGVIYVAPPDQHLRIMGDHIELDRGARENGHRPAVDPLFRSAADSYDGKTAGVILSGMLDDGTVGLHCIKRKGGATLVQDPEEALYRGMPDNAIAYAKPDYVQPLDDLVDTLVRLTVSANGTPRKEATVDDPAPAPDADQAQPGELAPFSCPDCGGTLWERAEGDTMSYRCRVGHAYTMSSLVVRHFEAVERALWSGYRALEERAAMSRRVARRLDDRGRSESAARFERQADVSADQAMELKLILDHLEAPNDPGVKAAAERR
jgi:two-component system chemotaxis response regulator CheB